MENAASFSALSPARIGAQPLLAARRAESPPMDAEVIVPEPVHDVRPSFPREPILPIELDHHHHPPLVVVDPEPIGPVRKLPRVDWDEVGVLQRQAARQRRQPHRHPVDEEDLLPVADLSISQLDLPPVDRDLLFLHGVHLLMPFGGHSAIRLRIALRIPARLISASEKYFAPIASATERAGPSEKIPRVLADFCVASMAERSAAGPATIRSASMTSAVTPIFRIVFAIFTASSSGSPPKYATFARPSVISARMAFRAGSRTRSISSVFNAANNPMESGVVPPEASQVSCIAAWEALPVGGTTTSPTVSRKAIKPTRSRFT